MDSFLADLAELSDTEIVEQVEGFDKNVLGIEAPGYCSSELQKTDRYTKVLKKVEQVLLNEQVGVSETVLFSEDDREYQLIVDCTALCFDIENEVLMIQNFINDMYCFRFPELKSLISNPIDYVHVVKKIGDETDLTLVDLQEILPQKAVIAVAITAASNSGKHLPPDILQRCIDGCDKVIALDSTKKKFLRFLESRMRHIAPNLSAIVGSRVAAQLMGSAGGLEALAKMPACNVLLLGSNKKFLAGFSTATAQIRVGYLEQTEVVRDTPPAIRTRVCRVLAAKSTLAARVDSSRGDPSGDRGRGFLEEICMKIEKWKERPPAKLPKPLPVPDSEPRKKRGGVRVRKRKQKYAMTDMRKRANRMKFGVPDESE